MSTELEYYNISGERPVLNAKDDGAVESYLNSHNYKRFKFIVVRSQQLATVNVIKEVDGAISSDLELMKLTILNIQQRS